MNLCMHCSMCPLAKNPIDMILFCVYLQQFNLCNVCYLDGKTLPSSLNSLFYDLLCVNVSLHCSNLIHVTMWLLYSYCDGITL